MEKKKKKIQFRLIKVVISEFDVFPNFENSSNNTLYKI